MPTRAKTQKKPVKKAISPAKSSKSARATKASGAKTKKTAPVPAKIARAPVARDARVVALEKKIALAERAAQGRSEAGMPSDDESVATMCLDVARVLLETGEAAEVIRGWLDRAVTGKLRDLERARYRALGPHWQLSDYELLGAACLVGRGPELVRAMAHFHSLGESRATPVWRAFLGRQGVAPKDAAVSASASGGGDQADALVSAGAQGLARALEKFLSGTWSTHARGMSGARVSFLATGLCAFWNVRPALPSALDRFVAGTLFEPPKLPAAPFPRPTLPRAPDERVIHGAPRDASRPASEHVSVMKSIAAWVHESLALAKNERAGEYLVSVPEACVDVATVAYAAGAERKDVEEWLAFAVDLHIARLTHRVPGDRVTWFDDHRELAAASILTDRAKALAAAWSASRDHATSPEATAKLGEMIAWLAGAATSTKPTDRTEWSGPFSAFATAVCKRTGSVPGAAAAMVMRDLL